MAIAEGLAAKAAIGLGALGAGATGIYFGGDYLVTNSLSKYDRALIEFLESNKEDYDFVFEVKKGTSTSTDFAAADVKIEGDNSQKVSVLVKVSVPSSGNTLFKKGAGNAGDTDEEFKKIKDLNQKQGWTWKCTLEFAKEGEEVAAITDIENGFKNRIFKDTYEGLFGILKKDLSNYNHNDPTTEKNKWTKDQLKNVKADFIRQCGYSRGLSGNKSLNDNENLKSDNTVSATIPALEFVKNGNNSNLIPKYNSEFNYWFKTEYENKTYQ